MTGSIALDVVIGLIFIYTLYSLLTTIIVEGIAVNLQLRARNLKHAIQRMLSDGESKELAKKFYETPLVKYLASGRYKYFGGNKYPSYLQPRNFADALIYILKFDSALQAETIDKVRETLEKYKHTETGRFLLSMLEDADFEITKFRKLLEDWFNDTMERATGWYKKNITYITLIVAFILVSMFNADTFQMVTQLSKDPKAREQYVQLAGQIVKEKNYTDPVFDQSLRKRLLNNQELRNAWGTDSVGFINFVTDSVYNSSAIAQDTLIRRMGAVYSLSNESRKILNFERKKTNWYIFDNWMNFLGCLVTAIALSMGAPFWFDLLGKLVQIKGSVFKKKTIAANADEK